MRKPSLLAMAALLAATVWGLELGSQHINGDIPIIDSAEATLTNLRTTLVGQRVPPDVVTIVAIDDDTARQAGGYPLPRAALAKIVSAIAQLHPSAIALDTLLLDAGPAEGDKALADALKQSKSILAAAAVFPQSRQVVDKSDNGPMAGLPNASELLLPLKQFTDVAALGFVNVQTDKSGTPRFVPMLLRSGNAIAPSFPLRVASIASDTDPSIEPDAIVLGQRRITTDIGHMLSLSFYGPRGTIRTVSAMDALNGKLAGNAIKDHVVVIGATVAGGGDVFPTPFDPVFPGVEVVATAITHLMAGDELRRDQTIRTIDAGIAILLPALMIALLTWRRSTAAMIAVAAVTAVWAISNVVAFANGVWLAAALPIATAAPTVILFGAAQLLKGRWEAQRFSRQSDMLQRIQAPGLGAILARNPRFLAKPVHQHAAVVFIDINGFTGLSETIGAPAVRELLNGFYDLVDEEATAAGGAIISFMGDGAMLVFGLPQPGATDATNALVCCTRLAERTGQWIDGLPQATASRIGFKIGAHCGSIVASRLGTGDRQQITVTGDTVNVASRLMEVAARSSRDLALSNALLKAADGDSAPFRSGKLEGPKETAIRGRAGSITIWLWQR